MKSNFKGYIEVFILLYMTVGPMTNVVKAVIYLVYFGLNIKQFLNIGQRKKFYVLIGFMMLAMIWDIRNISEVSGYSFSSLLYTIPFLVGGIWSQKYEVNDFLNLLEKVAFFTIVCSYFGMFILYFSPRLIDYFPIINYYGREIRTIGIMNYIYNGDGTDWLTRSCGIAFEPGAYQFVGNIGLAIFLMKNETMNKLKKCLKSMVYIGGILFTKSSTGIVILIVISGLFCLKSVKNLVLVLCMIFLLSMPLSQSLEDQIVKMETGNFKGRFSGSVYVLKEYFIGDRVLEAFPFGIGATGYNIQYEKNKQIGAWDMYTNFYLRYGFIVLGIFMSYLWRVKNIDWGIFFVLALTLLTEAIIGPILVILLYSAPTVSVKRYG